MIDEASEGVAIFTYPTRRISGAGMVPGPAKAVIDSVAVPSASGWTTIWKGSYSFLAAYIWMSAPVVVGGAASRTTLSMVVVVQSVALLGEGSAKVIAPVGVQLVQVLPPSPPPLP